jgi:hypothetical protein
MSDQAWPMNDQMKIWITTEAVVLHRAEREEGRGGQGGEEAGAEQAGQAHSRRARIPPGFTNIITMKTTNAMT